MNQGPTFTDEEVTAACGLHLDNLRRLITWGGATPVRSGGGRGRVRRWSGHQAVRISVTAQIVEVGFSLQIAHTLRHCLPLDDFLDQYDPSSISASLKQPRGQKSPRRKAIISPAASAEDAFRAIDDSYGGKIFIVDRRFMYSDLSGDDPELFAIIDPGFQRVIPRYSPYEFYDHRDATWDSPNRVLASSLLIEDDFLHEYYGEPNSERVRKRREHFELFRKQMPEGIECQINGLDHLLFRNLCVINLTVGLTSFVRNLFGLPNKRDPFEEKGD